MVGLLLFGLVLIIGLSLISRPVWRRRRYGPGYGPGYGGGWGWGRGWGRRWGWGAPLIMEDRREFERHRHHDGGWGGEHHRHHDGGWGGGGHHHGGGGWGGGGGHHGH
ncbi:MAG TPA: hypothetical protein VL485_24110 [Ktedonobacteraceae bacterium]|nr:hypothetical protein [Ktedonobacteraceae bacterium]